jgi:hypothetical protein
MDNTRDLPGYKYYVDPATGERPAVYVAYLDLAPARGSSVTGVVFRPDDLAALDERERNYQRVEVEIYPHGPVWTYMGTAAARERFEHENVVVSRDYVDAVRDGLARIGASTPQPPVPVVALRRVDL